ncbi:MAG: HAMP domain-containing histidine kinase [Clostridia bacterium]|nr:HAMP domain-containing histidine kinase [Clostridia bacterium]
MSKRENGQQNTPNNGARRGGARRWVRGKRRPTSTFFLLWACFSALFLLLLLMMGITQRLTTERALKDEAASEVSTKGPSIEGQILAGPPPIFNGNYSFYLRVLALQNGVEVLVLTEDGKLLYPSKEEYGEANPDLDGYFNFEDEVERMKKELGKGKSAVYEHNNSYVYGAKITVDNGAPVYLYVGQSFHLMEAASAAMTTRTVLLCVFGFILSFAVTSAIAGWLTRPLMEMTKKANRLAAGDFSVDFHGEDYSLEVSNLANTLNYARDELSKADRMQKELIANVSHDFKTPLTMIKAYASMIAEISGNNPEKRDKHAKIIIDEADRLTSLVNDVLDLSKLQSGIGEMKAEKLNVSAILTEVLGRFAYYKDAKGYKFAVQIDDGLCAMGDKTKIEQALYNLIGNAVNYTGEDKTVYIRLQLDGERFCFSVRDTGKGIKPEEIKGIWERYYRSSEAHKRPVQGTGLGLSIVKGILERHGLEYGVESKVGEGSLFYIWFPLV